MVIDKSIFRTYDIRGIVGKALTKDIVRNVGRVLGSKAYESRVTSCCVGRDGRLSSKDLSVALIEGIVEAGVDVIDIGIVPTPVLYYAAIGLRNGTGVSREFRTSLYCVASN